MEGPSINNKNEKFNIERRKTSYLFKVATRLSQESKRAINVESKILFFWELSMYKMIGKDILTIDLPPKQSELKWRVWKNSEYLMKQESRLALFSLSTWTLFHIDPRELYFGQVHASLFLTSLWDSGMKISISFPLSGSINPQEIQITFGIGFCLPEE